MASKNTTLDRYERRILEFLQQDGSLSNIELAEKVGLSPSPCSRRVQKLEEQGYISHRIAVLNQKKLGLDLTAIIQINIDKHTPERLENFEEKIRALPEVQQCYLITGQSADYVLQVVVPDMEAYQHFLLNKITRIDEVTGVHSSFVMRKVVDSIAIPIDHLIYIRQEVTHDEKTYYCGKCPLSQHEKTRASGARGRAIRRYHRRGKPLDTSP